MKNQLKERWPCMVGLSFFILLDGVVTLLGQSEGYWTNQSSPNERSAVGYILLEYSLYLSRQDGTTIKQPIASTRFLIKMAVT